MAENSKIEWCDHSANLWWGCDKIRNNPCCGNCYAEVWSKRTNKNSVWGHDTPRRGIKSVWGNLDKWQKSAEKEGVKKLVFTMSMGDIFEKSMPLEAPESMMIEEDAAVSRLELWLGPVEEVLQ